MIRSFLAIAGAALAIGAALAFTSVEDPFYGSDTESVWIAFLLFLVGTAISLWAARPALHGCSKLLAAWTDMKRAEIQARHGSLTAQGRERDNP
ncbi:hypothetical protein JWJ88_17220 [Paracoccus methylovorus]|uniref:Uncharacterized protein n=1 Tax=Paracoccus methylovorus TaxID=2812658 RepID=A0ABX7JL61_9RHOB|nr:hypothetical protein [Paracoccus methylovorus]QRZ14705.1 hypothetical protein JWJ88_17220 [Paracoccus methylovorus]